MDDTVVVARPDDGSALALREMTAVVWELLRTWCTLCELEHRLAPLYPQLDAAQRSQAATATLAHLQNEGLLEQR